MRGGHGEKKKSTTDQPAITNSSALPLSRIQTFFDTKDDTWRKINKVWQLFIIMK